MSSFLQSSAATASGAGTTVARAYQTQNCASGSTLTCVVYWADNAATCSVADDANGAWTAIGSPLTGTGVLSGYRGQMFYKAGNSSTAKPTVTATITGAGGVERGIAIFEYSSSFQLEGTHYDYAADNSGSLVTGTVTPDLSTDFAIAAIVCQDSASGANAPFTFRESSAWANNGTADRMSVTSGVGVACTFTGPGQTYLMRFIAIMTPVVASGQTYEETGAGVAGAP